MLFNFNGETRRGMTKKYGQNVYARVLTPRTSTYKTNIKHTNFIQLFTYVQYTKLAEFDLDS